MLQNRKGFTLIELLIVVVIIGILAAVAIPRFGESRQRAYVSAMQSDLRQVLTAQEMYYSDPASNYQYSEDLDDLNVTRSAGVDITITASGGGTSGTLASWFAVATHSAADQICAVFMGTDDAPSGAAPATAPGVIACGDADGGGAADGSDT